MILAEMASRVANMMVDATLAERFWGARQILGLYVAKTFWPRILCIDYTYKAFTLANSPAKNHVIIGIATLASLTLLSVAWWRRGLRGLALLHRCVEIAP